MKSCRNISIVFIGWVYFVPVLRVSAQCDDWRAGPLVDIPGVDGTVYVATTWDPDGAGPLPPQLVIGGDFITAGGTTVNRIARWDGTAWQPFGSGMTLVSAGPPGVTGLTVLPASFGALAGQLVATGYFDSAGGTPAASIARWDGAAWHALATSVAPRAGFSNSWVNVAMVPPPGSGPVSGHLIVGGHFSAIDGVTANCIADWNGTSWTQMGGGMENAVYSLTMWDPDGAGPIPNHIVAGGRFSTAGGLTVNHVAQWTGSAWTSLYAGLGDGWYFQAVHCVATIPTGNGPFAGQLVAGVDFTMSI